MIYTVDVLRPTGRYSSSYVRKYSLALLANGTIHLLDQDRARKSSRREAQVLLRGLRRGATVHEKPVGRRTWPFFR